MKSIPQRVVLAFEELYGILPTKRIRKSIDLFRYFVSLVRMSLKTVLRRIYTFIIYHRQLNFKKIFRQFISKILNKCDASGCFVLSI